MCVCGCVGGDVCGGVWCLVMCCVWCLLAFSLKKKQQNTELTNSSVQKIQEDHDLGRRTSLRIVIPRELVKRMFEGTSQRNPRGPLVQVSKQSKCPKVLTESAKVMLGLLAKSRKRAFRTVQTLLLHRRGDCWDGVSLWKRLFGSLPPEA